MKRAFPTILRSLPFLLCLAFPLPAIHADEPGDIALGNARFRYVLGTNGLNRAFVDLRSGTNLLAPGPSSCAWIRRGKDEFPAASAAFADGRLTLRFRETDTTATVRVEPADEHLRLTLESVTGEPVDAVGFLNIPLTLGGRPTDLFAACALSLNLITRVDALPVLQTHLRASAERKFGLVGARVALVATPTPEILSALRIVLSQADEMPRCTVAGPWAADIPFNHGSYLFNFGSLVETNVDDWIGMARSLAFTQIDNHGGGGFFRFGDFELNRKKWPEGWDTFARITSRLREAGIGSIFHTYAFFIDKQARYVTPVPDRRLDAFRRFTLAAPVDADANEIVVEESTAGLSTVTGFFEHNSVVLHLDDELVTFSGFSREAPWRFTGVRRGAHGTRAAPHARGTQARHLKECFGLFVPDPESTLFEEIAAHHAEVVNRCGFDGIYLDAIDGASILRGADECWYWADKFVFEIQRRLKKPVGMEMSAMWHHFWQYRTRWQAWDLPQRGHLRFVDQHAAAVNGGLMLPLHLGWWDFQSFNPPQIEPSFPEIMETLGARLVGWDAGLSLTGGIDREKLRSVPLFRRAVEILRQSEELRRYGYVDAATRAQLREPGRGFALVRDGNRTRFQRSEPATHLAALAAPDSLIWTVTNPFAEQPLRVRIEALMSSGGTSDESDTNSTVLTDRELATADSWKRTTARGVDLRTEATILARNGVPATLLIATNAGNVPRNAAWARLERHFSPPLDLKTKQALGFWVEGDGQGALLAIRLGSPHHLAFGAVADRYLPLDFTGPRFVTLVETESSRWSDFQWDDGKSLYNVYRETVDFGAIDSVSVWLQNLPPGRETRCRIGPVRAVPMVPATLRHPVLYVNGRPLRIPVELTSGQWIEVNDGTTIRVFGKQGEPLRTVILDPTTPPWLDAGHNELRLSGLAGPGPAPRARVTVFRRGDLL